MKSLFFLSALLSLSASRYLSAAEAVPFVFETGYNAEDYKITVVEDQRRSGDPLLAESLKSLNPELVQRALVALGRIGGPASLPLVHPFLSHADTHIRQTAAFALGIIKDPSSIPLLGKALAEEKSGEVRGEIYQALGRMQRPETLPILEAAILKESDPEARTGLAMGLCYEFLTPDGPKLNAKPATLASLIVDLKEPAPLSSAAAWALARYKGEKILVDEQALLASLDQTKNPIARATALKALAHLKSSAVETKLIDLLVHDADTNVRVEAASALAGQPETELLGRSLLTAANTDKESMVRAAALTTLADVRSGDLSTLVARQPSPWLVSKTIAARASRAKGPELANLLDEGLKHPDPYVKRTAIELLPKAGKEGLSRLRDLADEPAVLISSAAVNALHDLEKNQMDSLNKAAMLKQLKRHDPVITGLVIDAAGKFGWKDQLAAITAAANERWKPAEYAVDESYMDALGAFRDPKTLPQIEARFHHPVRSVAEKAVEAYKKVSGKDPKVAIPLNIAVQDPTPSLQEIQSALRSQVIVETNQGTITLAMLDAAPVTATKFVRWVSRNFYQNLGFHRVVPGFVVQGGDPRGDGEGGDGLDRDEVSMTPHGPYTVGIATGGKDTGSTQFFFNLTDNRRLDGAYTVFAQVIEGREVAARLEIGDKIIRATVKEKN